jgi:starch synthase (maltosyl-transferring)
MVGRIVVEDVRPVVNDGAHPGRAVVGEHLPVSATVWREGHDVVAATVAWRGPQGGPLLCTRMLTRESEVDSFSAVIVPDEVGMWTFRIDAWTDQWSTWLARMRASLAGGLGPEELANDLEEGARLLERVAYRPANRGREILLDAASHLRDRYLLPRERFALATAAPVDALLEDCPIRELVTRGRTYRIWVDRSRAAAGAWYQMFPRSTGGVDEAGRAVHGTFGTAAAALDRIAGMGFDVVYLPPIHPIGRIKRRGANNRVASGPDDVGSPWAVGSTEGGHDVIHPDLGDVGDFDAFVRRAGELGIEVALDFALQCAPDHPWVTEHPNWFRTRPDGSIACADNPPRRFEDIYPLDFDADTDGLLAEAIRVLEHWIDHGVRIFRVDNPQTKPPAFWHRLIWTVKRAHPDVLFLGEAFTRPAVLYGLARLGFTQNYTYFTWQDTKAELTEFGEQLVARADEFRPNLFVNTPDALPESVRYGGTAAFALRAALAATLAPTWGVYSGFELFERDALSEEHAASEKYQLRPRDFVGALAKGDSLEPWLARLNEIRAAHPALRTPRTLKFHAVDNDALIAYSRSDPMTGDLVLCVVTLDPDLPQTGTVRWDMAALGWQPDEQVTVYDEVSGELFEWSAATYVKLDPRRIVAHLTTPAPTEGGVS